MNLRRLLFLTGALLSLTFMELVVWLRPHPSPPPVARLHSTNQGPVKVFPGIGGVLFVLPDGTLWRWGFAGLLSNATTPECLSESTNWNSAVCGNNGTVAIKTDGTLWELRPRVDSAASFRSKLRQVGTDTNWFEAAISDVAAAALKRDGTLWTWGRSMGMGTLGDPLVAMRPEPEQVGTNRWLALSLEGCNYGFMGVTADGRIHAFGRYSSIKPPAQIPEAIDERTNWVAAGRLVRLDRQGRLEVLSPNLLRVLVVTNVLPGRYGLCSDGLFVIREDGTLWSYSSAGSSSAPALSTNAVQVGDRKDWVRLWSGGNTVVGLTADGTLWNWGTDWGRGVQVPLVSRLRDALSRAASKFGLSWGIGPAVGGVQAYGYHHISVPRPLLRMIPPGDDSVTGAEQSREILDSP